MHVLFFWQNEPVSASCLEVADPMIIIAIDVVINANSVAWYAPLNACIAKNTINIVAPSLYSLHGIYSKWFVWICKWASINTCTDNAVPLVWSLLRVWCLLQYNTYQCSALLMLLELILLTQLSACQLRSGRHTDIYPALSSPYYLPSPNFQCHS